MFSKMSSKPLILEPCKLAKIPECAEEATDIPVINIPKIVVTDCTIGNNPVSRPIFPCDGDCDEGPSVEDLTVEDITAAVVENEMETDDSFDDLPPESATPANGNRDRRIQKPAVPDDVCLVSFFFWSVTSLLILLVVGYYGKTEILFSGPIGNNDNLKLVPRQTWDTDIKIVNKWADYQAKRVVVTHTETETCDDLEDYSETMNELKEQEDVFEYNFFVAPDGYIYEALGWHIPSPLYPDTATMVVAFIGNYETNSPSEDQMAQFQNLIRISEDLTYLKPKCLIEGMKLKHEPKQLFKSMSKLENWDKERYAISRAIQGLEQFLEDF